MNDLAADDGGRTLGRFIVFLEVATITCGFVLLAGIFGENKSDSTAFIITAVTRPDAPDWSFSVMPTPGNRLHRVFQHIVEASIAGESVFGFVLIFANRKRAAADKLQIGALGTKIAQQEVEIANSNRKTEELRARNIELEAALEEQKQQTAAIFERMAWRTIDKESRQRLRHPLARLRHTDLKIFTSVLVERDLEAARYCEEIFKALQEARQSPEFAFRPDLPSLIPEIGRYPVGVIMMAHSHELAKRSDFFNELYGHFEAVGISVPMMSCDKLPLGEMHIGVGMNPAWAKPPSTS